MYGRGPCSEFAVESNLVPLMSQCLSLFRKRVCFPADCKKLWLQERVTCWHDECGKVCMRKDIYVLRFVTLWFRAYLALGLNYLVQLSLVRGAYLELRQACSWYSFNGPGLLSVYVVKNSPTKCNVNVRMFVGCLICNWCSLLSCPILCSAMRILRR